MAQTAVVMMKKGGGIVSQVKNLAVSLPGTGNTTILDWDVTRLARIFVEISNAAGQALDVFQIQARAHPDGDFITLYSTSGDFGTPIGLLVGTSGNLAALAAAAVGFFIMDVTGIERVRILASAAADSAIVSVYATGEGNA